MQTSFTGKVPCRIREGTFVNAWVLRSRIYVTLLVLFGCSFSATAQSRITGKVIDNQGAGLPGVSIVVKGTTTGTVSDAEGGYALTVPRGNETLVFSFIGYTTQEVPVSGRSAINITLASDDKMLNEVIVVGYGQQKKETVTGSVATVKGTELVKSPAINLTNSIAGRMPGVIATNRSGEPGNDGSAIRIRGSNTLETTMRWWSLTAYRRGPGASTGLIRPTLKAFLS